MARVRTVDEVSTLVALFSLNLLRIHRELHCVELGTDLQVLPVHWNLRAFHRLRKLRIDFDPMMSNTMLLMRFDYPKHIASGIQELEIYDTSWPSPLTIRLIVDAFSGLRTLKLCQDLIWCSLCNICCFSTFRDHPPEEIIYDKIVGLPVSASVAVMSRGLTMLISKGHYATYMRSLTNLEEVVLTISYGLGGHLLLSEDNANLWTGECDACMDMMYAEEDFRKDWVEKKTQTLRPPSLRFVKWRFHHKDVGEVVHLVDMDEGGEVEVAETTTDE